MQADFSFFIFVENGTSKMLVHINVQLEYRIIPDHSLVWDTIRVEKEPDSTVEVKSELCICSEEGQFGRKMSHKPGKESENPLAISRCLVCGFRNNLPCLGDVLSGLLTWAFPRALERLVGHFHLQCRLLKREDERSYVLLLFHTLTVF